MNKLLFSCLFLCSLNYCNAQAGKPDPSFGINGIIKADMGAYYGYNIQGRQIIQQLDGSMYLVLETSGQTIITKKHADGSTDLTYGNNGYSVGVAISGRYAAIQNDGKIVIVGGAIHNPYFQSIIAADANIAIVRINADGSLDNSFNGSGIVISNLRSYDEAIYINILGDGKIVIMGNHYPGPGFLYSIEYRNADGSLDKRIVTPNSSTVEYPYAVAIQKDGKIVIGGTQIKRYNSDLTPDNSFNENSTNVFPLYIRSIAIQSDGRIIAAGGLSNDLTTGTDFILSRYLPDGKLDNTFGVNGTQITDFYGENESVNSITIQSDGKIVLYGSSGIDGNMNFAIARYKSYGIIDSTFSEDGKQITEISASNDYIITAAIQGDGKLLALGATTDGTRVSTALSRYDTNGKLDCSFGGNGILIEKPNQGSTFFTCTAIQSDGKIIAAGYTFNGNNYDFAIVRYHSNGSFDNTFSGDGKQTTDFNSSDDRARSIRIQNDGKIVVAGSVGDIIGLVRYNPDGLPDNSFNNGGMQETDFAPNNSATPLAIQSDGKILVGGTALARYCNNGSPDLSFAINGKLTAPIGGVYPFNCNDLAVQNDGKIVILGKPGTNSQSILVARYDITGMADTEFGNNGVQSISTSVYYNKDILVGKSLAIQKDGKIIIGGYKENYERSGYNSLFALIKLNTDGSPDITFNEGRILFSATANNNFGTSLIIENDNKIILGGYSYNENSHDFTISRYNEDGRIDYSFGENGFQKTKASLADDRIAGLAISGNKLYAVGHGQYPGNFGVVARYFLDDCQAPVLLLNANVFVNAQQGLCGAVVNYLAPVIANECGISTIIQIAGLPSGATFPVGFTNNTFVATNLAEKKDTASFTVTVIDKEAPQITQLYASPASLWPPNHDMTNITVNSNAWDNCGAVISSLNVTSNEPVRGTGNGDKAPDWIILDNHHLQLRAERSGHGNGRIYTITITAKDAYGNISTQKTRVLVPHERRGLHPKGWDDHDGERDNDVQRFECKVIPNPSSHYFDLQVTAESNEKIEAKLFEINGRFIVKLNAVKNKTFRFGNDLRPGIYLVEIRQGEKRKMIKIVKQ